MWKVGGIKIEDVGGQIFFYQSEMEIESVKIWFFNSSASSSKTKRDIVIGPWKVKRLVYIGEQTLSDESHSIILGTSTNP